MRKSFENRTIKHLSKIFPDAIKTMLGPEGQDVKVREFIGAGIAKANSFDIRAERNVTLFIDLMIGFSPEFYREPRMSWVAATLASKELTETEKMNAIFDQLDAKEKAAERKSA